MKRTRAPPVGNKKKTVNNNNKLNAGCYVRMRSRLEPALRSVAYWCCERETLGRGQSAAKLGEACVWGNTMGAALWRLYIQGGCALARACCLRCVGSAAGRGVNQACYKYYALEGISSLLQVRVIRSILPKTHTHSTGTGTRARAHVQAQAQAQARSHGAANKRR